MGGAEDLLIWKIISDPCCLSSQTAFTPLKFWPQNLAFYPVLPKHTHTPPCPGGGGEDACRSTWNRYLNNNKQTIKTIRKCFFFSWALLSAHVVKGKNYDGKRMFSYGSYFQWNSDKRPISMFQHTV